MGIKASEAHLQIGQYIRVVYTVDRGLGSKDGQAAIIVDDMITPPVILRRIDPKKHEVEIERSGGTLQTIIFKELLPG